MVCLRLLRNKANQDLIGISFLFKNAKIRKTSNTGKIREPDILPFRFIFFMFRLVFCWFPMVGWCGICVIEQNGKYHLAETGPLPSLGHGPWTDLFSHDFPCHFNWLLILFHAISFRGPCVTGPVVETRTVFYQLCALASWQRSSLGLPGERGPKNKAQKVKSC